LADEVRAGRVFDRRHAHCAEPDRPMDRV
jgi:hypothetical protein